MLTIVEADKDLCKRVVNGNIEPYGNAYLYTPELREVKSLEELSKVLTELEGERRKAVLRDAPRDMGTGRRLKTRYAQVPAEWLCLDWDQPAPEGCPDYVEEPEGAIEFMIDNYWSFLRGVGVHWQLGNSAGIVPSSKKMSIHMWVWLDRGVTSCSRWLGEKKFDSSMTRPVQIHYTASPLGAEVPRRSGLIPGGVLRGVREDPPPTKSGIAFSEGFECTDDLAVQMALELAALRPINGERHSAIRHWVIRAVTVQYPNVQEDATNWLVEQGRDRNEADSEIARMVAWADTNLKSGQLNPDVTLRPDLGFDDDEPDKVLESQVEVDEQCLATLGQSLLETLTEAEDPFDWIKANAIGVARLPGLERERLRDIWPKSKKAFDEAVKSAAKSDAVATSADGVLPNGDWRSLARCYAEGTKGLVYSDQSWFGWNGKFYEEMSDVFVEKACSDYMASRLMLGFTGPEPVAVNRGSIANVVQQLSFDRLVKDLPLAASLVTRMEGIPFENGVLMRNGELIEHSESFFSRYCLGFDYVKDAECPYWLERLSEYMDGDEERILLVRQWFHYLLFGGTELQRICVMVGQPRGGKGTIMRVMERLLGAGNTTSPTMGSFLGGFGLQSAVGKRAILIGDAHLPRKDATTILSLFKTISGEDSVEVNRKHKEALNVRLGVIVMACNELESIKDESNALTGRYSIINFRRSFMGAEDSSVEANIMAELAGIFNWAMKCPEFDRLVETKLGLETKGELIEASNPVRAWAEVELESDVDGKASSSELLNKFQNYYSDEGGHKMSKAGIVKALRQVFPYASVSQWRENGKRIRGLSGVKFICEIGVPLVVEKEGTSGTPTTNVNSNETLRSELGDDEGLF